MLSGVYQIRNLVNGKRYVGSAVNLKDRWRYHQRDLGRNKHHSSKLQRAWNKYGADAFVFEVMLHCDPENCVMYEQIAMDHYKPEYNICRVAGSSLGRRHSKETKKRISESVSGENNARPFLGKKHSKDSRLKMSEARCGKYAGENHPRARLDESQKQKIQQLLTEGVSQSKIASLFKISQPMVSHIKTGRRWK